MTATKTTGKPAEVAGKTKAAKKAKAGRPDTAGKRMSALDAAAGVLAEKGAAMSCPELIGVMAAKGYWSSPNGKTPAATLYAGIIKEIGTGGPDSRFRKTAPGRFAATDAVGRAEPAPLAKKSNGRKAKKAAKVTPDAPVPGRTPGPEAVGEPDHV